ncbi:response regulator [Haloferula chungangensis]|uniref:Response regulator n=1 Tax=Haloferula chungangensis TaxID=1048331 RepID=A0ABW2L3H3_9BACT
MITHRIILIEDHAIYRKAVSTTLDNHADYNCVAQFSNMEDALEAIDKGLVGDIILLDLGLPAMGGIDGIGALRGQLPDAKIIILTALTDREKVFAALEAGAHGYLVKAGSPARLLQNLAEVIAGGTPLDPQIAGMVLRTFQKLSPIAEEDKLAPREKEILQLVAQGLTKLQVADELGISPHSVSGYLRRAFDKLHVHSLPAAVSAAIRRGLLDLS